MTADAYAIAAALRDCLCERLKTTVGGAVCSCCIETGIAPATNDNCCNCGTGQGQASIQLGEMYPSDKFPRRGIQEYKGPCTKGLTVWVQEIIVSVYRCVPTVDENGYPTCEERETAARKIFDDRNALMDVFTCCDWSLGRKITPGSWVPLENKGGCGGGMMTFYVNLGAVCCTPADPVP
jgi:hypothetical protein